jgi:hypothetical protein
MTIMCACLQEESYKDARSWIEVRGASGRFKAGGTGQQL